MTLDYSWNLFQRSWKFPLSVFYVHRIFSFFQGIEISFGIWMKFSKDRVISPDSASLNNEYGRYTYTPLETQHVRLLELEAGCEGDPLRGNLVPYKLTYGMKYEALSYVWGEPVSTASIFIQGYAMPITHNLESALRTLRLEEGKRLLWIDAICINQSDILERNQQVEMMGSIYSSAQNVNIWLGPASPDSEIGMETLRWFLRPMEARYNPPWESQPPILVAAGLSDILNRPWFRRIWVVQEAAMSRRATMICGRQMISWTNGVCSVRNFMQMIKFAVISPQWERAGLKGTDMNVLLQLLDSQEAMQLDKPSIQTSHRPPKDLLDNAYEMHDRLSTDPRDKIFALLGLSEGHPMQDNFHVDYKISVDETYQRLWGSIRSKIVYDSDLENYTKRW